MINCDKFCDFIYSFVWPLLTVKSLVEELEGREFSNFIKTDQNYTARDNYTHCHVMHTSGIERLASSHLDVLSSSITRCVGRRRYVRHVLNPGSNCVWCCSACNRPTQQWCEISWRRRYVTYKEGLGSSLCLAIAVTGRHATIVGGLLPLFRGSSAIGFGQATLTGSMQAVQDINNRTDVLPDYELVVEWANSGVCYFLLSCDINNNNNMWTYIAHVSTN